MEAERPLFARLVAGFQTKQAIFADLKWRQRLSTQASETSVRTLSEGFLILEEESMLASGAND